MSILGHIAAKLLLDYPLIGVMAALGVSIAVALALRVYRPRAVVGPPRVLTGQLGLQLIMGLGMGLCTMIIVSAQYYRWRGIGTVPPGQPPFQPGPVDMAFLNTVPPLAYFVTLWLADWAVGGIELLRQLGLSLRRIPAGVAKGLVAAVVIVPPTYVLSSLATWAYQRMHIKTPAEHDLLKGMRVAPNPHIEGVLILAAVLVAPVVEEFLFRGHLQTLIRKGLVAISSPFPMRRPLGGFPMPASSAAPPAAPTLPYATLEPLPTWQTWLAIVITSILFTVVHPLWMAPPIFFLSLGLGYCYERTGNLWTSMTLHCLFNSISTFAYLNL